MCAKISQSDTNVVQRIQDVLGISNDPRVCMDINDDRWICMHINAKDNNKL